MTDQFLLDDQQLHSDSDEELVVTEKTLRNFKTAGWFMQTIGIVFLVFLLIFFFVSFLFFMMPKGIIFFLISTVFIGFGGWMLTLLLNSGTALREYTVYQKESDFLTFAIKLKTYFQVFSIIMLVIIFIGIVFSIAAGLYVSKLTSSTF